MLEDPATQFGAHLLRRKKKLSKDLKEKIRSVIACNRKIERKPDYRRL